MGNLFHPESGFMAKANKVVDLAILSCLWTVCSLTVVGFGPATAALYYAVVKAVRCDRGSAVKAFFDGIKKSWKPSLFVGLMFLLFAAALFAVDIPGLVLLLQGDGGWSPVMGLLSLVKLLVWGGLVIYTFPLISRFAVGGVKAICVALTLCTQHIAATLLCTVLLLTVMLLCIWRFEFLFLLPGAFSWFWSFRMEPLLRQCMTEEEQAENEQEDQWYLEVGNGSAHGKENEA